MDWSELEDLNNYSIRSILPQPPQGSRSGRSLDGIGLVCLQIGQSITGIFLFGISPTPSIL